jgi:hypothetical protein
MSRLGRHRRSALLIAAFSLAVGLAGCTGGDDQPGSPAPGPDRVTDPGAVADAGTPTSAVPLPNGQVLVTFEQAVGGQASSAWRLYDVSGTVVADGPGVHATSGAAALAATAVPEGVLIDSSDGYRLVHSDGTASRVGESSQPARPATDDVAIDADGIVRIYRPADHKVHPLPSPLGEAHVGTVVVDQVGGLWRLSEGRPGRATVQHSTDGGRTWDRHTVRFPTSATARSLAIAGAAVYVCVVGAGDGSLDLLRGSLSGASWAHTPVAHLPAGAWDHAQVMLVGNHLLVGDGGAHWYLQAGARWSPLRLPGSGNWSVSVSDSTLLAVGLTSTKGVWRSTNAGHAWRAFPG